MKKIIEITFICPVTNMRKRAYLEDLGDGKDYASSSIRYLELKYNNGRTVFDETKETGYDVIVVFESSTEFIESYEKDLRRILIERMTENERRLLGLSVTQPIQTIFHCDMSQDADTFIALCGKECGEGDVFAGQSGYPNTVLGENETLCAVCLDRYNTIVNSGVYHYFPKDRDFPVCGTLKDALSCPNHVNFLTKGVANRCPSCDQWLRDNGSE